MSRRLAVVVWALVFADGALAQPDGPPWDSFGGPAAQSCTTCHFDNAAVEPSPTLVLKGLPGSLKGGATYGLTVRLESPVLATAGFLLAARWDDGRPAGRFEVADARTETEGAGVRSTRAGIVASAPGMAEWSFLWWAPDDASGRVTFWMAANAANDDASPLGDVIHLNRFRAVLP